MPGIPPSILHVWFYFCSCEFNFRGNDDSKAQTKVFLGARAQAYNPSFVFPVLIVLRIVDNCFSSINKVVLRKVDNCFSNINKKSISLLIPLDVFKADLFQNVQINKNCIKQLCMGGKFLSPPECACNETWDFPYYLPTLSSRIQCIPPSSFFIGFFLTLCHTFKLYFTFHVIFKELNPCVFAFEFPQSSKKAEHVAGDTYLRTYI